MKKYLSIFPVVLVVGLSIYAIHEIVLSKQDNLIKIDASIMVIACCVMASVGIVRTMKRL